MDISYIILTWNSDKYITRCLESLIEDAQTRGFSHEILIVDNGSSDDTIPNIRSVEEKYPGTIRIFLMDRNTGTTYPRNLALKQARGRYIGIIDSDVEFIEKGTAAKLIQTLEKDDCIGLAAPGLLYPNGRLQKSTDVFPTLFRKLFRYFFLKAIEDREDRNSREQLPREVDYAISAVWMMKREVLEKVGLLDENIFYSPEDADYCLRLWKAGYRIVYNPQIFATHHTQEISRGFRNLSATFSHIRGLMYYFRKHRCFLMRPAVGPGNFQAPDRGKSYLPSGNGPAYGLLEIGA